MITQIEECLKSRPLVVLSNNDGVEALTPGHFLIGRLIEAQPDPSLSFRKVSLLRRWHQCQNLSRHLWKRWSYEYLASLRMFAKWNKPQGNLQKGDVVVMHKDNIMVPTKWPLGRVIEAFTG